MEWLNPPRRIGSFIIKFCEMGLFAFFAGPPGALRALGGLFRQHLLLYREPLFGLLGTRLLHFSHTRSSFCHNAIIIHHLPPARKRPARKLKHRQTREHNTPQRTVLCGVIIWTLWISIDFLASMVYIMYITKKIPLLGLRS